VKVNSLPYVRYGTFKGRVEFVSPDTLKEEVGKGAYRVQVSVAKTDGTVQRHLPQLIPGMEVQVDIVTRERRIIEYFFDPIIATARESFREL
jgi:adhesin transport system membrane fusion protein